jgi:hypothetical protein
MTLYDDDNNCYWNLVMTWEVKKWRRQNSILHLEVWRGKHGA